MGLWTKPDIPQNMSLFKFPAFTVNMRYLAYVEDVSGNSFWFVEFPDNKPPDAIADCISAARGRYRSK